jgi:hypothetical protein
LGDVVINFNVAYLEWGVVISQRKLIAKNYIKSWFLIDFFAGFPLTIIFKPIIGEARSFSAY